MSSSALDSQGMLIKWQDTTGSPYVYTTIPEVSEISGPGGQAAEIDVTDLSSTAKEFRMGLQDEGQITLSLNYIPQNAVHEGLRTDRSNQSLRSFHIVFTDSPETTVRLSSHIFTLVSGKHFYLTDEQGGNYLIRPGKNIIGRQAGCDVVIDPVYRGVSRKHLIIEPVSESFALVTDISSHGTYVPSQVF